MEDDKRIKKIRKLQAEGFIPERKQSLVLNNFYAIITIATVCISIIFYIAYIVPAQNAKAKREQIAKEKQEYFEQRTKQIALSQKLNQQQKEKEPLTKQNEN